MRNQPFSDLNSNWSQSAAYENPRRRPILLMMIVLALQLPVVLRLIHIQGFLAESFVAPWRIPSESLEEVPARDGRILTRDGVVLAQDEVQYNLSVDYRWLEKPFDEHWVNRQINRELSGPQRKDQTARAAVRDRLLEQRQQLISGLAEVSGISTAQIEQEMSSIQQRIEAMQVVVETRRENRQQQIEKQRNQPTTGISGIWQLLVEELTSSPDRFSRDPIILKEELQDHVVLRNVPLSVAATIQSQPARFLGVQIRGNSTRDYPQLDLASHLVGIRRHPPSRDVSELTRVGETGIERFYNETLQGQLGQTRLIRNRHGELISSEEVTAPRDGRDMFLTLDSRIQRAAEQLIDEVLSPPPRSPSESLPIPLGATIIAMDIRTGEILALASGPRPELPMLVQPTQEQWRGLQENPARPLFSRGTQMALSPGSLFKVVTAVAALESGALDPDEILSCQGFLDQPDRYRCLLFRQYGIGHGQLRLNEALSQSCHVCFHELARRMGPSPVLSWAHRLGLGHPTGIDLPSETKGRLPEILESTRPSSVSGETLQLGVGQGGVICSPLQVARLMSVIANGGMLVTPHVSRNELASENELANSHVSQNSASQISGNSAAKHEPVRVAGLSSETLSLIRLGLEESVSHPRGVAAAAKNELVPIAATLGTGSGGEKPDHAWVAGYAPAQHPRLAIVVVLEHGGAGENAIPLFRSFVTELLGFGELRPENESDRLPVSPRS